MMVIVRLILVLSVTALITAPAILEVFGFINWGMGLALAPIWIPMLVVGVFLGLVYFIVWLESSL